MAGMLFYIENSSLYLIFYLTLATVVKLPDYNFDSVWTVFLLPTGFDHECPLA